MEYSVIDIETTGFSPKKYDKIIEIGIVKIDDNGNIIETFETLINPNRDVGATHIHGITAEMLINAPTFNDISKMVLNIIDGTIIIAHHATFDMRFIESEMELSGYNNLNYPYICTLDLARRYLSALPSKKLEYICQHYGIINIRKHSALSDSKATSTIFHNMRQDFNLTFHINDVFRNTNYIDDNVTNVKLITRKDYHTSQLNYISPLRNLLDSLPIIGCNFVDEDSYLSILQDFLLDRIITEDELTFLSDFAIKHKMSKDIMLELHRKYIENLIIRYLDDGIISDSEKKDINTASKILMLENTEIDKLIENIRIMDISAMAPKKDDFKGKTVCFTGNFQSKIDGISITRKMAEELAISKGLIKKGVIKKLDYLILSDVHSQSSKAKKARDYGITLVTENAFWSMIGVQVE